MMRRIIFVAMMALCPSVAQAAGTFCIGGFGMPPQCIYDDVVSCLHAADPPNTACLINNDAVLSYIGGSRYCTVGSERVAQCFYVDRQQCNTEATRVRRICVDSLGQTDENNPFRYDNRVQN
jgi:hypothetical protein